MCKDMGGRKEGRGVRGCVKGVSKRIYKRMY